MQTPTLTHLGGFTHSLSPPTPQLRPPKFPIPKLVIRASRRKSTNNNNNNSAAGAPRVRGKKENVWSVDNEIADKQKNERVKINSNNRRPRKNHSKVRGGGNKSGRVLVSSAMLVEVEKVLQTQEPVIRPAWNTFASSVSGIWKGIGGVFSPITAEMEPIDIGSKGEKLYDCYTLSRIEAKPSPSGEMTSQIHRKINWVTLNPYGEVLQNNGGNHDSNEESKDELKTSTPNKRVDGNMRTPALPHFESFDFGKSDVMEEDVMSNEPGLVFFEDGSYSRGPIEIPVGEVDHSKYYLNPTFKFEQCLVKGCHKRLRIVHTIEFANGGANIQIMRVAVYEEQWVSPANLPDTSDINLEDKPFSQRKRVRPSELTGQWKVFEVSATPIYGEDIAEDINGTPYVYLCTENLKKRGFSRNLTHFGEEEIIDTQDATILWLPGGVTGYVDVNNDGILTIGVGWYSDEGINLVMERDYGTDGKLKEVRSKSEVKRRWSDTYPV